MKNNIPFYIATGLIFILLKFKYRIMETDSLVWLLKPVSLLVEIMSGVKSIYLPGGGYYFEQLNMVINKSCSGFNFWLLCFLMLNCLGLKFCQAVFQKMGVLLTSIIVAYILTVLVNSCRIITSSSGHQY